MNNEFTWTAWFSLTAGLIVLAMLPNFSYGIPGYAGLALTSLAAFGAVIALTRGWLMLSISSKEKSGHWPVWGLFQVLPWIAFTFSVVVVLSIAASFCWWSGAMFESTVLTSVPIGVVWRDYFSKIGYVVTFASLLWKVPGIFSAAYRRTRSWFNSEATSQI